MLGSIAVVLVHKIADVPLDIALGIYSGAVTNTPALGGRAANFSRIRGASNHCDYGGVSYAMAYPFGICGILLAMWLIRLFFNVKVDDEAARFNAESSQDKESLHNISLKK